MLGLGQIAGTYSECIAEEPSERCRFRSYKIRFLHGKLGSCLCVENMRTYLPIDTGVLVRHKMALLPILELCLAVGLLITPTHGAYVLKMNYSGTNFTSGFDFRTV
jgi:hypothetical protein